MRVRYIGTGEAFDHRQPNTSVLVDGDERLLLDCGYSVPHALWAQSLDPDFLDGIYLSHFHADHCFGLPALLGRMNQDGRTRPLWIVGGPGGKESSLRVLRVGYPSMPDKLRYPLQFVEIVPGSAVSVGRFRLSTALSKHSVPNHSVRIEDAHVALAYSGDGALSDQTEALYECVDLLIHEAYYENVSSKSHSSMADVRSMALRQRVKQLHMLHLSRDIVVPKNVQLPQSGDEFLVGSDG